MKIFRFIISLLTLHFFISLAQTLRAQEPSDSEKSTYVEGQVLVKFKPTAAKEFFTTSCPLARLEEETGVTVLKSFGTNPNQKHLSPTKLLGHPTHSTQALIKLLKDDPAIEYVEPNYYRSIRSRPNDPHFQKQWGLENTGQLIDNYWQGTAGCDIGYLTAQEFIRPGPVDVIIAVGDSGIQLDHPDLEDKIWINPNEIPGNGIDDDNNDYIDDTQGYDFGKNRALVEDNEGHGTHVAGIIAAKTNNEIGITGAFSKAKILPLAVEDANGNISSDAILNSLNYVTAMKNNGANIVAYNFSLGGAIYSQSEKEAIEQLNQAGVIVCAATDNRGQNSDLDSYKTYPDCYEVSNIIAVGGSNLTHGLYGNSNYGLRNVDLAAPGRAIYSAAISGNGYEFRSGCSQSTPYVSAAVAMAAHNFPEDTVEERIHRILNNTTPSTAWEGKSVSGGILNLTKIVNSDGDELPDWWEEDNFSDLSSNGEGDRDRDGLSDIQEYLSGTNPTSANSTFKPETISVNSQEVLTLEIKTLQGRTYQLQVNSGLEATNWQNLGNSITGDGTIKSFRDTLNVAINPKRFYRIRVTWE